LIKRFGLYLDPVYKFKIFNKSITLKAPYRGLRLEVFWLERLYLLKIVERCLVRLSLLSIKIGYIHICKVIKICPWYQGWKESSQKVQVIG